MNPAGEPGLQHRLQAELFALPVSPAPVAAATRRGRDIATRRRRVTCAVVAVFAAITTAVSLVPRRAPGTPAVTLDVPDPRAPGGVFASGMAAGRPWRLAVRDLAATSPPCLPAVMLNGQDADLLPPAPGLPLRPAVGRLAFLAPGPAHLPAGVAFLEVSVDVTRVVAVVAGGGRMTVFPVTLTRCGMRFRLAGFAYPARGVARITTYYRGGGRASYAPAPGEFSHTAARRPSPAGRWEIAGTGS